MNLQYKIVSKFYDLADVFYFNGSDTNPRNGIVNFIPDKKLKVLEVCVGTAANSIIIAKNRASSEITGIDLSKEMLALAKKKIEKKEIRNIRTLVMDATSMNFDDNSFDVVLISLVLHEVDDNIRNKIMNESKRVLKSGGKIIIMEWDQPKKFIQKLLFLIIKVLEPKGFKNFLKLDIKRYIESFDLKVMNEKKYDYTKIIEAVK